MKKAQIANWLFYYYLFGTILIGLILIILGPSNSLLSLSDNLGILAIIIPVFIGQLTIIFQWFIDQTSKSKLELEKEVNISSHLLKFPATAVLGIFFLAILLRGFGVKFNWIPTIDEAQFRTLIIFGMSILNATTLYLVALFYKS